MSAFNQEKALVGAFSVIVKSSRNFGWSSIGKSNWGHGSEYMGQFSTKNIFHLIRFEHFIHSTKFNQFESRPSNKKVGASLTFDNISCVCVSNDYVSVDDDIHVLRSVLAGTKTENQQLGRGVGRGQDRAHERKKNVLCQWYNVAVAIPLNNNQFFASLHRKVHLLPYWLSTVMNCQ